MRRAVARAILSVTAGALFVFAAAVLPLAVNMNRNAARDGAETLLNVLEARITADGGATAPDVLYAELVRYADNAENIRISVIDPSGAVLADSLTDDAAALGDHSDRKEVVEALKNGTGGDVRRSGSFGTSYLYTAKKVTAGGGAVVLRAATELRAVNAYIWGVLGLTAGIFAVVLLVTGALSRTLSVRLTRPFGLIKDRLDAVLSPDAAAALPAPPPAEPTDYPEVNAALSDIAVLSDRVRDTLVSARKLAKEKQEFFANASHELNTPLSSILGWCETMLLGGKYERAFLETIDKEATRMKNLIADMLSISSLEGGGATEDAPLNIKDVAAGVTTSFQPRAREKDITIYADLSDGIIHADREKIIQLISNLVDNAVKYGNHGGNVWIKTECAGGAVTLTVRDDGIGIPKKYQNRVFERFFRVDKGRARSEGTGLGLSIVKHIASRYDATLTLTGSETTGTEIKVTFKQLTGGGGVVV